MLVPDSNKLYVLAKRYVDRHEGRNNCDMATNGEPRILRTYMPRCRVVFDVGANISDWTRMALTINSLLDVHCFEPSKDTFQVLNQLQASFPSVRCNNIGLGSAAGEAQIFVFAPGSVLNSLYRRIGINSADHQTVRETVQIDTFDNYCHENNIDVVDFVKVDVEGHELEVFNGMC